MFSLARFSFFVSVFSVVFLTACNDTNSDKSVTELFDALDKHYKQLEFESEPVPNQILLERYNVGNELLKELKKNEASWPSLELLDTHVRALEYYIITFSNDPYYESFLVELDSYYEHQKEKLEQLASGSRPVSSLCWECEQNDGDYYGDDDVEDGPENNDSDGDGDGDGDGGDSCDSKCEAEKTEEDIEQQKDQDDEEVEEGVQEVSDEVEDKEEGAESVGDDADKDTLKNQQNGAPEDETCEPVAVVCGSKITQVDDWIQGMVDLSRKHRLEYRSAWSLGPGWHWSLDSRLIHGTALGIDEQLALYSDARELLVSALADIERRQPFYKGYLNHSYQIVKNAAQAGLDMLASHEQPLQSRLDVIDARLAVLEARKVRSEAHRTRNQYVTDPSHRAEEAIGEDIIKWVSPKGDRMLFLAQGGSYQAMGVNPARLVELGDGFEIQAEEGKRYRFSEHGLLIAILAGTGERLDLERDDQQRADAIVDHLGNRYEVDYSGDRLSRITDPAGRRMRFDYDGQDRLVEVTQFDGRVLSYEYEYAPEPLALTRKFDGEGKYREYRYRQQGGETVVARQIDAAGYDWTYDYDFDARVTVVHQRAAFEDGRRVVY
ncbi:MAG: hypothetical protein WED11_09205, partial [Natronospirillum sp.]